MEKKFWLIAKLIPSDEYFEPQPDFIFVQVNYEYVNQLLKKQKIVSNIPDLTKGEFKEERAIYITWPAIEIVGKEFESIFSEVTKNEWKLVYQELDEETIKSWATGIEIFQSSVAFYSFLSENPTAHYGGFINNTGVSVESCPVMISDLLKEMLNQQLAADIEERGEIKDILEQFNSELTKEKDDIQNWFLKVVHPIADGLKFAYKAFEIEIQRPYGLLSNRAEITIYLSKDRAEEKTRSVLLVPVTTRAGTFGLHIRDYSISTDKYPEGTVGFESGFNHPDVLIPDTFKELMDFMDKEIWHPVSQTQSGSCCAGSYQ
jgi:hypothetical protein